MTPPPTSVALLWDAGGRKEDARGHAYLKVAAGGAVLSLRRHGPASTPGMLARLERWEAQHGKRGTANWRNPRGGWRWTGDLGAVVERLQGRDLTLEGDLVDQVDEAFLRAPARSIITAKLESADARLPEPWPSCWTAKELRFGPGQPKVSRGTGWVVMTAARPGSAYSHVGQRRTAAVFMSRDEGKTYDELPWVLDPKSKTSCWPPETLLSGWVDGKDVRIEWEDPWIDWEPGEEWLGVYDGSSWRISTR